MKLTELAELILTELYDEAERNGHVKLIDIVKLAQRFGEKDGMKVYQAAKFLHNADYIKATFTNMGPIGWITGNGCVLVEQGGNTGIINRYRENPASFQVSIGSVTTIQNVSGTVAVASPGATQQITSNPDVRNLFDQVKSVLQEDKTLSETERSDALADVETLALQAGKQKKDVKVIERISDSLSVITSVKPLIEQVVRFFTGT